MCSVKFVRLWLTLAAALKASYARSLPTELEEQMTDEELDEIFAALSTILTDSGLDWLVAQVNENIQVGQLVTRTFHRGEPEDVAAFELTTKTKRNTIVGTDPYGAAERVDLLVSAIRVALADSAALERAVGHFFAGELPVPGL